jgi:EmrB/QacA subfamily drug resistance transporter
MTLTANPPCDRGHILAVRAPRVSHSNGAWILLAAILGSSMVFIDGTVVNVALPVMQRDLNTTSAGVQWIVEAYALFLAALLLLGGSLGDRYGRRRIFALGVAIFTSASVACGLSPGLTPLVVARALQGIGGALLAPASLAIIGAAFSDEERGRAIGTWSGFTAITSAAGPVLGGWLVQHASWRWVFFINVPIALGVLALIWLHVPESRDEEDSGGVDWLGASLAAIGLGSTTFGLLTASASSLSSPGVAEALALGAMALIGFLIVETRVRFPMVPLALFRSGSFSGANLLTLFLYAGLGGALYFLPFDLIQVQGYPPTAAGLALLPFVLIMFTLSRWSGGLVAHYGAKLPLVVGPAIAAAGFALFARPGVGGSYWATFFPATVVLGFGMAISVAPLTTTVMSAAGSRYSGTASGINNAVSRMASLLAVALFGLVAVAVFSASLGARLAPLHLPTAAAQQLRAEQNRLADAEVPAGLDGQGQFEVQRAIDGSFVSSFRLVMLLGAGLALASALTSALMIGGGAAKAVSGPGRSG